MGKKNKNNLTVADYYLGLDVGTNSSGWAVTDLDYNISKFHGKHMWGARLFDEASTSEDRRTIRNNRRRLARRNKRLEWLGMLFNPVICKKDPTFFIRMNDSFYHLEDKTDKNCKYSLFNDDSYTDKEYFKQYPTIYHLRSELIHSTDYHDPRLVYLAIYHILKHRGHFLFSTSAGSEETTIKSALDDLKNYLMEYYSLDFSPKNIDEFVKYLSWTATIRDKKIEIKKIYGYDKGNDTNNDINLASLLELLVGASVKFKDLFNDDELKNCDPKGISLKDDLDEKADQIIEVVGDERFELIQHTKIVYDLSRLSIILGDYEYLSDSKVALFNKNNDDLKTLKQYVKEEYPNKYNKIFKEDLKDNNYVKYSKHKISGTCSQEEFCAYLKKELPKLKDSNEEKYKNLYLAIEDETLLTKLKSKDNSVIPYQVQRKELNKILENASKYLPLSEEDANGLTISNKIKSIFEFRVPYYVGPLNKNSSKAWLDRKDEIIYPWNFDKVVNTEQSANNFMENLIGKCTYTGDNVLPLNSLLYSKYMVLNEINLIKINEHQIDVKTKQEIYKDLFLNKSSKVTKNTIVSYLRNKGLIDAENDVISGIDVNIKSNLKPYHDFKGILGNKLNENEVEEIIQSVIVFGDDKNKLKKWLDSKFSSLDDSDIKNICKLKYKDWGRLSKTFLNGIEAVNDNGEVVTIIDELWNSNKNLMQIINTTSAGNPSFIEVANEYKINKYGANESIQEQLNDMYISPKVKRSIWQTLRIVDEIVDIKKGSPKKIFIEMARTNSKELKGKRTESRKDKLLDLYKSCGKENLEVYEKLKNETNQRLRREKLYLYYTQFGKCMYSGETIDNLDALFDENDKTYDVDHIFPRSKIKDDSLDNKVLVKSSLNRDKTNIYPINENIRNKMRDYWKMLHDRNLISDKKYDRLIRPTPLTSEELSEFVARQLVETQQSTKALATVLQRIYPESKIVYSKAGNVSDFRHEFDILKFRDINDLHHAKDAYLNIVVGNVYDTKFTNNFFANIENEEYSLNKVFDFDTKNAWISKGEQKTIDIVKKYTRLNDPIITFMPKQQKGSIIAKVTIQKAGFGQLPIKNGLDMNKYGGYRDISGSYFALIEHDNKGKRERTIFPVYLYANKPYCENPIEYCEKVLNLSKPKIIVNKILFNSIFEFEGDRVIVTGRSNSSLLVKHSYQLSINDDRSKYLKFCKKYVDYCDLEKKEVEIREKDLITSKGNIEMFEYFLNKLSSKPYNNLFKPLIKDLSENQNKFNDLSMYEQCKVLLNILNAFKCDRTSVDISLLNGKKTAAVLTKNSCISNLSNCKLINQSITGLYETKIDLLK